MNIVSSSIPCLSGHLSGPTILPDGCLQEERVLECLGGSDPLVRVQCQATFKQVNKVVEISSLSIVHTTRRCSEACAEIPGRLHNSHGSDVCLQQAEVSNKAPGKNRISRKHVAWGCGIKGCALRRVADIGGTSRTNYVVQEVFEGSKFSEPCMVIGRPMMLKVLTRSLSQAETSMTMDTAVCT